MQHINAVKYVVYCFAKGENVNIDDASKIVAITANTYYELPAAAPKTRSTYVVTALDRVQNESKQAKKKVKF